MTIKAKFTGKCGACGGAIAAGDAIEWARGERARHAECPASPQGPPNPQGPAAGEAVIHLNRGEGYGGQAFRVGATIRNARGASPEWVTVLAAHKKYYGEDGMSFGVGDEAGWVFWAEARAATAEEIAPLAAAEQARHARREAAEALETEFGRIVREGECPQRGAGEEQIQPEGERLWVGERDNEIYGGGRWLVLGTDWIWAVRNNGADGDDWAHNNVRTGGAGAIGRRVPAEPGLAAKLMDLAAKKKA
jgi:hypothetical protein